MTVHERAENNKKLKSELNLHFDAGLLNVQSTYNLFTFLKLTSQLLL